MAKVPDLTAAFAQALTGGAMPPCPSCGVPFMDAREYQLFVDGEPGPWLQILRCPTGHRFSRALSGDHQADQSHGWVRTTV